jgi:rhodanese-related sulfurtransferase
MEWGDDMSLIRHYEDVTAPGGRDFEAVLTPEAVEALRAVNPRTRLLDVRTPGEYEAVHIRGSYNVPLDSLGEHAAEIRTTISDPVVLVCQSGARARRAEDALRQCSMTNLHVLDGGVTGWVAADMPVVRGPGRLPLERQVRVAAGAIAALGAILALAVNPLFAVVPAFVGSGLVFAGLTDNCALALVLSRLPYNRPASCDVDAMVAALKTGAAPSGTVRGTLSGGSPARSCGS